MKPKQRLGIFFLPLLTTIDIVQGLVECEEDEFPCNNGKCIRLNQACDRIDDCGDGSDEVKGVVGFKCVYKNNTDICNLPQSLLNDEIQHCDKGEDEFGKNNEKIFTCFDDSAIVTASQQCDGIIDCRDLSDECPCEDKQRESETEHICFRFCSPLNIYSSKTCKPRTIECDNSTKYINLSQICDGFPDCTDMVDEKYCLKKVNFQGMIYCPGNHENTKKTFGRLCDGRPECFDLSDECNDKCYFPFCQFLNFLKSNSSFKYMCPTTNVNETYAFTAQDLCNGVWSPCSPRLMFEELKCPARSRYYCNNDNDDKLVSVDEVLHCDGYPQCDNSTDELNCSGRVTCDDGLPYSVPKYFIRDGISDCQDGSDECPTELDSDDDIISSRTHMINSLFLRIWVWVIGLATFFANVFVLFRIVKDIPALKSASAVSHSNHYLIFNLALADLLLGIYLIAIGIKNESTAGTYCKIDYEWRSSIGCSLLGSLAVISSQVSIFMLIIIATIRLYCITRPIAAINFNLKWTIASALIAWTVGLILAFLPLSASLINNFTISVFVPSKFLDNKRQNISTINHYITRLEIYSKETRNFTEIYQWNYIKNFLSDYPSINIKGEFAYYSRHAICVPDYYLSNSETAWEFPSTIIIFNFLAFLYLPIVYIIVYKVSSKTKIRSTGADRSSKMQRKIIKLMISDFLCWMPICLVALLNITGIISHVTPEMYAATAILILPTNSLLNPLLYSDAFEVIGKKIFQLYSCIIKKDKFPHGALDTFSDTNASPPNTTKT